MKLTIEIEDNGVVMVRANDELLGLIESMSFMTDMSGLPRVYIRMAPALEELGARVGERRRKYVQLLRQHPLVKLLGPDETLPSGMPSVRPD